LIGILQLSGIVAIFVGQGDDMAVQRREKAARHRAVSQAAGPAKFIQCSPEIGRAFATLAAEGKVAGARSAKISVRVDPGVLAAAAARFGIAGSNVSDVVNASLAIAAAPDRFKEWLRNGTDTLPDDFELAI
jgi:hypothetical protein